MRIAISMAMVAFVFAGCDVAIPNGLFGCGQQSDCPSGYHCWASDSRCYDASEPTCQPRTCEQVIGDFASLGIPIECGSLPNGCDGSIECGGCPEGTQCGANGENFVCGCEELTCATFQEGAECGAIATRCPGSPAEIDCGDCFGQQVCDGNRCVCPAGVNCSAGCGGGCDDGEVCVEGECCAPTFPCSQNECSPPGGLDDGCGGTAQCPPCGDEEECVLSDESIFECLGDCTCEAQGVECGSATICGQGTLCGTCRDNGYDDGYRCASGRCICADTFEPNDTIDEAAIACEDPNCLQEAWGIELNATVDGPQDVDYYSLQILDAETLLVVELLAGEGDYKLFMTYLCPNGEPGMTGCSGSTESFDGLKYCTSPDRGVGITRFCEPDGFGEVGTLLVGIQPKAFPGICSPYDLSVFATYGAAELD